MRRGESKRRVESKRRGESKRGGEGRVGAHRLERHVALVDESLAKRGEVLVDCRLHPWLLHVVSRRGETHWHVVRRDIQELLVVVEDVRLAVVDGREDECQLVLDVVRRVEELEYIEPADGREGHCALSSALAIRVSVHDPPTICARRVLWVSFAAANLVIVTTVINRGVEKISLIYPRARMYQRAKNITNIPSGVPPRFHGCTSVPKILLIYPRVYHRVARFHECTTEWSMNTTRYRTRSGVVWV